MANVISNWLDIIQNSLPCSVSDVSWWGLYTIIYLLLAAASYYLQCGRHKIQKNIADGGRILFVIAHPDDECMFFGPTIVSLTSKKAKSVHVLCLSRGNYRGDGLLRDTELVESCERLGVLPCNLTRVHCDLFPDDPKVTWDVARLAEIIARYVVSYDIDRIVTFDDDGVSGHSNHSALYRATLRLVALRQLPKLCRVFALDTVGIFRKYMSFFDVFPASFGHDSLFVISFESRKQVLNAMMAHKSQLVWFRRLYLIFSRYIFVNGYTEVTDDFNLALE